MSFLMGDSPQPMQVPASPLDSEKARQEREAAANAALADSKQRGRASTQAAGKDLAAEEQYDSGLLAQKRRAASRELVG